MGKVGDYFDEQESDLAHWIARRESERSLAGIPCEDFPCCGHSFGQCGIPDA